MKIGILTFYHGSENYGAILQAYALNKYLTIRYPDFLVETIDYSIKKEKHYIITDIVKIFERKIWNLLKGRNDENKRIEKFALVRNSIPHSKFCNYTNINDVIKKYDILIAGSDQIWNPDFSNDINYFLPFNKKCLSYAASIGKAKLNKKELDNIIDNLKNLDCISVREKSDEVRMQPLCSKKIYTVLDPTLLLEPDMWLEFIGNINISEKNCKYDLFYILGDILLYIPIIQLYLNKNHNIKIICLNYTVIDNIFTNVKNIEVIHSAGPKEFLSEIWNAELIFTDSFHATAFSCLFKKQFIVFPKEGMNERVITLLDIFNLKNRLVSIEDMVNSGGGMQWIDYSILHNEYKEKKESSIKWLEQAIRI